VKIFILVQNFALVLALLLQAMLLSLNLSNY